MVYPNMNCDSFVIVDFERGPVEIRCTQVGEHIEHRSDVFWSEVVHTQVGTGKVYIEKKLMERTDLK